VLSRTHFAVALAGFALAAHSAESQPKKSPPKPAQPDIQFLEYLGSVEADDENWTDVSAAEPVVDSKASTKSAAKVAVEKQ
jgi:hypothetical protein